MDTSEQYINMCRKATELQAMWEPHDGDFFYYDDLVNSIGDFVEVNNEIRPMSDWETYKVKCKECVWLPRIDQLHNLSEATVSNFCAVCMNIAMRYEKPFNNSTEPSFEQIAMFSVMAHLYNKSWNGEDWIKA